MWRNPKNLAEASARHKEWTRDGSRWQQRSLDWEKRRRRLRDTMGYHSRRDTASGKNNEGSPQPHRADRRESLFEASLHSCIGTKVLLPLHWQWLTDEYLRFGRPEEISGAGVWTRWCFAGCPGSTGAAACNRVLTNSLPPDRSHYFGEPLLLMDSNWSTNRQYWMKMWISDKWHRIWLPPSSSR